MEAILNVIHQIIAQARERVATAVNHERTLMYWQIGQVIVEEQQQGAERAGYKEYLLKNLSQKLVASYGDGYSRR